MATQFFQLRSGDPFILQGVSYMKLNEHKDENGSRYNAIDTLGNYRLVLPNVRVTPDDEYFLNRITPGDAHGNRIKD